MDFYRTSYLTHDAHPLTRMTKICVADLWMDTAPSLAKVLFVPMFDRATAEPGDLVHFWCAFVMRRPGYAVYLPPSAPPFTASRRYYKPSQLV